MAPQGYTDALSKLRLSKPQRWTLVVMKADLSWHKASELQGGVSKITLRSLAKRGLIEIDYVVLPNDIAYKVTQRGKDAIDKINESGLL